MGGIEALRSSELSSQVRDSAYYNDPERRKLDAKNQALFNGVVERLGSRHISELPDLRQAVNHDGGRSTAVIDKLDSESEGILLYPGVNLASSDAQFSFIQRPLLRIGREDSRRQIFFGELAGITDDKENKSSTEVAVSVIPSNIDFIKHEQALHEIAMYQYAASLEIPTLDIVAVIKASSPGIYGFTLTRYEPDIRTLDTLEWGDMDIDDAVDSLSYAVDTLALLHANYIFHGDTAFRNIAVCDASQQPKIIDLELSGSLREQTSNIMKLSRYMSADFSSLAASLDMNINHLYQDESGLTSPTDRFDFMYQHIFLPYYDRLIQFGVTPSDSLGLAFDNVVSRRLDEAIGGEGRWKHF